MAWQSLDSLNLTQQGAYVALPVGAAGGAVNIRIPAFAAGEAGRYKVGIYSGAPGNPGFIAEDLALIKPYQRYLRFEVPANTPTPLLGLQLTDHDDLANASYSLTPEWQLENPGGAENGGAVIPMALTVESVVGLVSTALAGQFASYGELIALVNGLELIMEAFQAELVAVVEAIANAPTGSNDPPLSATPPASPSNGELWREANPLNGQPLHPWPWQWLASQQRWISRDSWIASFRINRLNNFRSGEFNDEVPTGFNAYWIPELSVNTFVNSSNNSSAWKLDLNYSTSDTTSTDWTTILTQGMPYNVIHRQVYPVQTLITEAHLGFGWKLSPVTQNGFISFLGSSYCHVVRAL